MCGGSRRCRQSVSAGPSSLLPPSPCHSEPSHTTRVGVFIQFRTKRKKSHTRWLRNSGNPTWLLLIGTLCRVATGGSRTEGTSFLGDGDFSPRIPEPLIKVWEPRGASRLYMGDLLFCSGLRTVFLFFLIPLPSPQTQYCWLSSYRGVHCFIYKVE